MHTGDTGDKKALPEFDCARAHLEAVAGAGWSAFRQHVLGLGIARTERALDHLVGTRQADPAAVGALGRKQMKRPAVERAVVVGVTVSNAQQPVAVDRRPRNAGSGSSGRNRPTNGALPLVMEIGASSSKTVRFVSWQDQP